MEMRTISVELDVYEKLLSAQKPGESLSEVIRRTSFDPEPYTGAAILEYYRKGGSGATEEYLSSVEEALKHDQPPDDPWA
jgi:hypothetical protein